jgi:SAM-dependent methyltransferase
LKAAARALEKAERGWLEGLQMITARIKNIYRGLKQRWGSSESKQKLWDREYAGGRWDHCEKTPDSLVYQYVEKFCSRGNVLDLGCGWGNVGNEMKIDAYGHYTGVDVSEVAIGKGAAISQSNGRKDKNRFFQADIISYEPERSFDVILFRESIYYVPLIKIKTVLDRYAHYLTSRGVFVVAVSPDGSDKGPKILETIERNFQIVDRRISERRDDFIVVFKRRE